MGVLLSKEKINQVWLPVLQDQRDGSPTPSPQGRLSVVTYKGHDEMLVCLVLIYQVSGIAVTKGKQSRVWESGLGVAEMVRGKMGC